MVPLIESHGTTTWALKDVFEAVKIQHPGEAKSTIGFFLIAYLKVSTECYLSAKSTTEWSS